MGGILDFVKKTPFCLVFRQEISLLNVLGLAKRFFYAFMGWLRTANLSFRSKVGVRCIDCLVSYLS